FPTFSTFSQHGVTARNACCTSRMKRSAALLLGRAACRWENARRAQGRLGSKLATNLPARQTRTVPSDSLTLIAIDLVFAVIPAAAACLAPSPAGRPWLSPAL